MVARSSDERAAVMAALMAGQAVSSVAKEYNLPEGTVKAWKSRYLKEPAPELQPLQPTATKKAEIGELLVGYLRTNLETLRVQAEFFQDREWLAKQGASELAVLHGVMTDKSIRLLEALNNAAIQQETESE